MPRVKGGVVHSRKRKRLLKAASGMTGASGTLYRPAVEFVRKAGAYAYRDRRQKKRHYRSLWISRLSAAVRLRGISYNRFIASLIDAGIELNRKMLSELAIADPTAFDAIVEKVRPLVKQPVAKAKA
jgi:large subunit ribosomal protein L20